MSKSERHISLENFDPTSRKHPFLNSPRSVEACRRQGIDPEELLVRTIEEIKHMFKEQKLDNEAAEIMGEHLEERRREKVRVLLEERAQLIEDERNGYVSFSPNKDQNRSKSAISQGSRMHTKSKMQSIMDSKADSTLIEREKRQLEKIKYRQEKEIQNMIEHESKMAEIRRIQEEKIAFQKERERQRQAEVDQKRREEEERRRNYELEMKRRQEQEEEKAKRMAKDAFEREQRRIAQEKENERIRKIEARKRDEEAKRKQEEFKRETDAKLEEQQRKVAQKKAEMEERDRQRQEYLREQQHYKQHLAEEKRREKEYKIKSAKDRNDEILYKKRQDYERKQAENEERRKEFEKEVEQIREENRRRAEQHSINIKRVIEENNRREQQKKDEYFRKKELAEERKRELDQIEAEKRRQKMHEEWEKDHRRKQIKENMESRMANRIGGYLDKMNHQEEKMKEINAKKAHDMKMKKTMELIRKYDKQENVKRIAKMQQYQRDKVLEKIQDDNEKAERIKEERAALLEMRMQIRREMDSNKQELVEKFDKVKRGKMDLESLSTELQKSKDGSQMHAAHSTSKQGSTSQKNFKSANNFHKGSKSHGFNATGGGRYQSSGGHVSDKDAKKMLDDLKLKQNDEMLAVLKEEQDRENERETHLQSINDENERIKVEKVFAMERAKAHARIQQLADTHDDAIRTFMHTYNIKNIY